MEVETIIKPQLFMSSRCDRAGFQPYENDVYLSLRELVDSSEDYFVFPVCHGVMVPASSRRLDLGCTTGNHALFMLCSFTNHVLAKPNLMRSVVLGSETSTSSLRSHFRLNRDRHFFLTPCSFPKQMQVQFDLLKTARHVCVRSL